MTTASPLLLGYLGAVTVLAVGGASASARSPAPPLSQCVDHDATWTALDDHRIVARSIRRTFLITTEACPRLGEPLTHVIVSAPGGTPICERHDVHLYIGGAGGIRTPCSIRSLTPLSPDEVRALRPGKP